MSIGIWQLVLILIIVFVIFGAGKLPRVMGDVGKGVRSLRDGLKGEGEGEAKKEEPAELTDVTPKE
jgi:sec-independent protein translocase protein TatA